LCALEEKKRLVYNSSEKIQKIGSYFSLKPRFFFKGMHIKLKIKFSMPYIAFKVVS